MSIPQPPPSLHSVIHYLKVALEHEQRDFVVCYWARFYAVNKALEIDRSSPEAKVFLGALLNWLEVKKKWAKDEEREEITNEAVADAHIENYAHKLFKYADDSDRKGVFNKNTVKAFYTSSLLIDILQSFNNKQLTEELEKMRKYGKWKAAYIHNCLKNGETPIAGPVPSEEDGEEGFEEGGNNEFSTSFPSSNPNNPSSYYQEDPRNGPSSSTGFYNPPPQQPQHQQPPPPPQQTSSSYYNPAPQPVPPSVPAPPSTDMITLAQKYTKFASSSLNFDDVPTAIDNLRKALNLLELGHE